MTEQVVSIERGNNNRDGSKKRKKTPEQINNEWKAFVAQENIPLNVKTRLLMATQNNARVIIANDQLTQDLINVLISVARAHQNTANRILRSDNPEEELEKWRDYHQKMKAYVEAGRKICESDGLRFTTAFDEKKLDSKTGDGDNGKTGTEAVPQVKTKAAAAK